jgi:hypothetical protein
VFPQTCVGLPLGNDSLPQEQPTRYVLSAEPTCQVSTGRGCHWQPASKRNAPAVPRGLCRLSAAIPLGNARLPQDPHQEHLLCRTNLTGEHTEGLPRHPRKEPASKRNAPAVLGGLCRLSAELPVGTQSYGRDRPGLLGFNRTEAPECCAAWQSKIFVRQSVFNPGRAGFCLLQSVAMFARPEFQSFWSVEMPGRARHKTLWRPKTVGEQAFVYSRMLS